jgi:hypothetical protein
VEWREKNAEAQPLAHWDGPPLVVVEARSASLRGEASTLMRQLPSALRFAHA